LKINFIYGAIYDNDSKEFKYDNTYKLTKDVDENESIKNIAISIAIEAAKKGDYYDEGMTKIDKIFLNFPPLEKENPANNLPDYHFDSNGEVIFFKNYEKLEYDWTLKELKSMQQQGYIKNDISTIYINFPQLGGGPELLEGLKSLLESKIGRAVILFGAKTLWKSRKKALEVWQLKEIREIADYWVEHQGVRSIEQLKNFVIDKGNWELQELSLKLKISQEYAQILLLSLGYELKENKFIPSYSDKAIQARKEWDESEVDLRRFRQ
jgi:hypothetical protein